MPRSSAAVGCAGATFDYFIPSDVIANKPFKLAVKVTNEGYGEARDFAIETAQPVIYYNPSGLLLDFEIIRSQLQGEERSTSMKVDFGDIQPGESKIAWWDMVTSIDGTFTEFTGEFTHSSELGGMETSLIKEINTYIIQKQMDSGELGYDFLANSESDENYYILFNSSTGSSTFVNDANYAVVNMPTPDNPVLDVSIEDYTGDWVIVSIEDPYNNAVPIEKVIRTSDGTEIPSYNYWMRNGRILIVDHYDEGFDGEYSIIYIGMPEPGITINSPNGGEDWQNGTTQTIQWSYAGNLGSDVQIELLKSGIVDHEIIASTSIGSSGTGSYSWTIPSTQIPGTDYQIRVTSTTNSAFTDTSDGYFEISPETPLFTRETVEYINLTGTPFNLSLIDIKNNPTKSNYMVVVSPLLAQAFVAEDEKGNQTEIQKKIDEKANQIEEALTAVLSAHPDAYVYFIDKDLGYQSNIEKLRADVYGLPFMNYIGPGHFGLIDTFILGKIEFLGRENYGPITSYKELTGKETKPTNEVWKEYSNKVKSKTKSLKPEYILILGSAKEFPEYKIYSPPTHFLQEFFIFSDIQYATYNKNIIQTELISIGRLPIDYSSNYLTSKHSFSKNAIIHSMYNVKQKDIKIAWTWDIVLDNYFKTFINPNLKTLTNQILEIEEPDVNSISQGSILGGNKNYYVDYYIFNENYPNDITVDLNDEHSLFIAGWHGNTRGISAHGGNINFNNMHPLIFTGTSCLISNTADYKNDKLGNPDKLFSYELLSNGASLVGNTMYGVGSTNKVIVTFNENLIQSETLGDAWLKTIKKYNNNLLLETGYARDQFRLLGDPALDTSALDDPLENNVSPLPQYFSISINASYNETQVNDYSLLNINMSSNSSLNINYTLTEDQYSPGSGSPMVPFIYLDIPMPVNQTIDNVTVVFDNSYTQIINLVEYVSYLLTPDGAKVIPGIELHGDYPSVNFTYSLVTVPDERLLKIAAIPVKYNIDNRVAELYRSINITVNTMPYVEENVTAKVHIDPSMDYLALHQSENVSLILSLYNDYSATENATDISVIAEIPNDLEVIDTDGTQIGHNITWEFDNLSMVGVNSFRSVEMVIQAPVSILGLLTKKINVTATYSNESGGFYEPTESSIQISLIPPDYMDLKVSSMVIQKPLKLGTQTNVSTVISNEGDIGLKYVPVTILIDGNESSGGIIDLPANENINLNLSINGLEPGIHQISVIVQPIGLETNFTNNVVTEEVDIYFAMLSPLSPNITYNLSNGSTLPIKFTVKDNDTGEFIYDDSVNIFIFNSSDSIIENFNVSSGIQIDLDNKEYAVGFDTKDYSQLTLGEIYTVSVAFGSQLYATADFTIIEDLNSPFSITHLNSTEGESWINWTWVNPLDPDFNHTEVYLNGTFITNIPAPQNYYNATGLLPDTSYELSTRTVDAAGNINETWVNGTAHTLLVSDDTPPTISFISPTDPSGTILNTRNWTFINISLSEPGVSWLEWNGINESMAGSGTNWYINKTDLVNDLYTYRVWANDSAGNENVSETMNIEFYYVTDNLPPIITITSPINDTLYTTDSVKLNYSVNEPTVWEGYSLDGADNISLFGNTTLIGINDGLHTLTVYANDTSGNMNSSMVCFTIDTTPPECISDLQHTAGQTWINWTWTNPPDPDFDQTELYLNGTFLINIPTPQNYYNITGLPPDTSYELSTRTVDTSGNINETWVNATARTLSVSDDTPPAITFISPTDPSGVKLTTRNWTFINISLSEPGFSWLEWNGTNESMSGFGIHWYINKTGLDNGVYTYHVWANDSAGNVNISETRAIEIDYVTDTLPPVITITSPVNDTTYNTDSIDLNYSVNEPTTWQGYSTDGAANITLLGNTTLTGFNDGLHNLTVYANDTSGNMNSSMVFFTIDTTPPEGISNLQHTAGITWLNWTWKNPHDLDFNHTEIYLNSTFITNVPASQNYYNATGLLPDTSYELSTRTVDTPGNINETWVNDTARTLSVSDDTPPAIIFISPTDPSGTTLTTHNWTFINVSLSEPGLSWLEWNGINESMSGSGTYWYINKTGLDNGVYTYRVWANDSAGNVNVSETRAIEIDYVTDTLPPVIKITSPISGTTYHTDSVNLNYSVNEPTIWQGYSLNGAANITLYGNATLTDLTDGLHTLTVYANDTSMNMNSSTVLFTVDTTPPEGVSDLQLTAGQTWINWTWTNPPDTDFNHTEIYLNGTFLTNIPAPQNYYNVTGLLPDTTYELSTRTVDTSGNINETWVNATARTLSVSDDTPPDITFISLTDPSGTILTTRNWTFINVSLSEPGLSWLEWNDINESMSGSGTNWYINKTNLVNGVYTYRVWANDTAGNENSSETRTIEIDFVTDNLPPIISITSPMNNILYTTNSVELNYTINEPTIWEGYSLDGADNITLFGNTTLFGLNDASHILTIYTNDTSGNMNSSTVQFAVYTSPHYSSANITFVITDNETKQPIKGATVSLHNRKIETNETGMAVFTNAEFDEYKYSAKMKGYKRSSGKINVNEDITLKIELMPKKSQLKSSLLFIFLKHQFNTANLIALM